MSEALEMMRAANAREHKGVNGIVFRYVLPDVQACMAAGDIPLPLLRSLKRTETEEESDADLRAQAEAIRNMQDFQRRLVTAAVFEMAPQAGEPFVPVHLDEGDFAGMHPDDFRDLFQLAERTKDPEGKE